MREPERQWATATYVRNAPLSKIGFARSHPLHALLQKAPKDPQQVTAFGDWMSLHSCITLGVRGLSIRELEGGCNVPIGLPQV